METQINIRNLLRKFREGTLSADDTKLLYRILENHDNIELDTFTVEEWNKASNFGEEDMDSARLLKKIHIKAGITHEESDGSPNRTNSIFRHIIRYAAVFLIAFLIAWKLKPTSQVVPLVGKASFFTIKVDYGSKSTVELPDSSTVILNSGSTLTYPDRFEKDSRTVSLIGEGFFEVRKNSHRPFFVKTSGITIKVLGTKFNVKSYPDENIIETTLVTGSVEIFENNKTNSVKSSVPAIFLKPNQKAVFIKDVKETKIVKPTRSQKINLIPEYIEPKIAIQKEVKTELYTAWKNNILVFNNDSFPDIIKKLERWYDVEITLQNESLSSTRFSAKFDKESVTDVLHALQIIQPFKFEINKNKIIIH